MGLLSSMIMVSLFTGTELFECENDMNHISFAVPRSYPTLAPMASFEPLSSGLNSLLLKCKIS